MKVTTYVNGKEVPREELNNHVISHPVIDQILHNVNERLRKSNVVANALNRNQPTPMPKF